MTKIQAPQVKKIEHKLTTHGDVLTDNYYWLREKENPEVIAYLEAENAYMKQLTTHTKDLQDKLYKEMVARIDENDLSVPVKRGDYYYYYKNEKGKNYDINYRKKGSLEAEEVMILDENQLAEGKSYFRLGIYELSPNQKILAYGIDTDGSEFYDIYFKNLETGEVLKDKIERTGGSLEWANDNKTVFYSMLDEAHRPHQIHRYELGSHKSELVFEEPDDRFFIAPDKSKSGKYLFINMGSSVTSEVRYLEADNPTGEFKVFSPRQQNVEYSVEHHEDKFYIVTNEEALNFKIMSTPVDKIEKANWTTFKAHNNGILYEDIEAFKNHLVVYGRKNGYRYIEVIFTKNGKSYDVEFPEPVYTFWKSTNPDYNSTSFRMTYSSLITPRTVYDFDMNTKKFEKKKEYTVKGGYNKSNYVTERVMATAPDGTKVPMSIAYKKGMKRDGNTPCYLYAYGSYGSSMDPYFSTIRVSLLERGFVFALAHIRGGSEMGRQWYEDGKYLKKKNTFTDFIACAEHLIQEKYTSSEKLAISGGSAGGLLMGAVVNMRPDLFQAVIASVPFVDVMHTMLDETIPLTVTEYEEWGNPNDKIYYDYMKSYSPYDNVEAKDYPHMLITAGLNDPRVQYWEPAKWTAKLRELKTDNNDLLLKTNMGAGHGGASGRYEQFKEYAFEYAFVMDKLGVITPIKD